MVVRALFLFAICSSCYGAVNIEKYLKICDRQSSDVNDCLVEAVSDGIEKLANGIKELDVDPIDPYLQKELEVEYSRNQIHAKMAMRDIYVTGLKEAKVRDVRLKANEDSFYMEIDMTSPYVNVKGRYAGEGSYNALSLNTTGKFAVNMSGLVYTWKIKGKPETIDNQVYMRITSFYMRPDVSDMKIALSNDSPEIAEIIQLGVRLSNQNWRTLYKELLPHAQSNWNDIGVRVANKIFLKVPYDQLFPNNS